MIIKNGLVHTINQGFIEKDLYIENGLFSSQCHDNEVIDATDCYIIPGLVDIHFHGCMGKDFCDATVDSLKTMAHYELQNGVTSICPASMSYDEERLISIVKSAYDFSLLPQPQEYATLRGIHLEGPFISMQKKGAQNAAYIQPPSIEMYKRINEASHNLIKLITLAPEVENALSFIKEFSDQVHISIGHTNCDYETALHAFHLGVDHITHLFNAMPTINHRNPGPILAAVNDSRVMVEVICDGIHIHPAIVAATLKMFGNNRVIFISDSMRATGMPDGDYELGGQPVHVTDRYATLQDGTLAGSASNLLDCIQVAVSAGIPLTTAVTCASYNPAKSIHIDSLVGSIDYGKIADCVFLDQQTLQIRRVIHQGILL